MLPNRNSQLLGEQELSKPNPGLYNTVIPQFANVVFHETNGPFYWEDMVFPECPEWAPTEDESDNRIRLYMKKLTHLIDEYLSTVNCEQNKI